jgi:hypothetical protein
MKCVASRSSTSLVLTLSWILILPACTHEAPDFDKLMKGIQTGNIDAVRAELDKGFGQERLNEFDGKDVPVTPLHLAALNGQTQIAALLLDRVR